MTHILHLLHYTAFKSRLTSGIEHELQTEGPIAFCKKYNAIAGLFSPILQFLPSWPPTPEMVEVAKVVHAEAIVARATHRQEHHDRTCGWMDQGLICEQEATFYPTDLELDDFEF